jgi:signal peptidase II
LGIGVDQLTKLLAVKYLKPIDDFPIIKDVFHFTFTTNDGMAWGMLDEHRWIFMSVSTIMIAVLGYLLFAGKLETRLYKVSVAMIISGGIGNMIDRIALGEVVDFLSFCLIDFPIFNIADSIVCIGAGMLVLALVIEIAQESRKKKSPEEEGKK